MPRMSVGGPLYQLHPDGGNELHRECLIEAFDSVKFQSDVTIHCKNKTQLKTNKLALIFSSKLFAKIFADSESNQFQRYDVLCPEFDLNSMAKVLELVNTGSTKLGTDDDSTYKGMVEIIQCLQIKIKLTDKTFSKFQTNVMHSFKMAVKNNVLKPRMLKDPTSSEKSLKNINRGDRIKILNMTKNNKNSLTGLEMEDLSKNEKISPYSRFQSSRALEKKERNHMTMNEHLESDTGEEKQRQEDNIANLDSSLTDEIIPTVPQDLKTNGNLYFCEYCDKALTGFKSYYLHFRKHAIGSQSSLNQDKPTTDCLGETEPYHLNVKLAQISNKTSAKATILNVQEGNKRLFNKKKCFTCPICQSSKTAYLHLLTHVASNHFKDEFHLHYDKTQRQCGICGKKFKTYDHLVSHLVSTHKFLAQILPTSLMEKLNKAKIAGLKNQSSLLKEENFGAIHTIPEAGNLNEDKDEEMEDSGICMDQQQNLSSRAQNVIQNDDASEFFLTKEQSIGENNCSTDEMILKGKEIENLEENSREQGTDIEKVIEAIKKTSEDIEELSVQRPYLHLSRPQKNATYECPICKIKKTAYGHLRIHVGRYHFQQEFQRFYNKSSTKCMICFNIYNTLDHLQSHLLSKHQILNKIISPELLKQMEDVKLSHLTNSNKRSLQKQSDGSKIQEDSSAMES